MRLLHPLAVACALVLLGCGPVLSTMVPASTVGFPGVRATAGLGASVPLGAIGELTDTAEALSKRVQSGESLSDEEVDELFDAAAGLALNGPSVAAEGQARLAVLDAVDLGLRLTTGSIRLDGRWQFLSTGIDASVGLGVGRFAFKPDPTGITDQVQDVVELSDYVRWELDVPLLFGWSGTFGHLWFGPKLVYTRFGCDVTLHLAGADERVAGVDGSSLYVGGQVGGGVGLEFLYVLAELTVATVAGSAELSAGGATRDLSFGGLVVYPAAAVMLEL